MRSGFVLLACAQLAIGAAAIFARFALAGGGPVAVSAARLLIASVPLGALAVAKGSYRRFDRATEWRLAGAGVALALHFACWIGSLRYASVAVSTLLVCTTPIWTEAFAVLRARRVRLDVLAGIACGLGGVAVVIGAPGRSETPLGIGLALAGALAIAIYLLLVRAGDPRYGTLAIVARTYPIAAAVLLVATVVVRDPLPAAANLGAWGGILAMALISQLFGHTALNAAVRRVSPTLVATTTLIEPVIAGVLAAAIFGERLAPRTVGGAIFVLGGIALALRAEPSRAGSHAAEPLD